MTKPKRNLEKFITEVEIEAHAAGEEVNIQAYNKHYKKKTQDIISKKAYDSINKTWVKLRDIYKKNNLRLGLHLYDGKTKVSVAYDKNSKRVIFADSDIASKDYTFVSFDADTMVRLLPSLVIALGQIQGRKPEDL